MKVGVLTYHSACNFGANLQALSTVSFLKQKKITPIIIDWMPKELESIYIKNTPIEQYNEHKRFREKYFNMTSKCYNDVDIAKVIDDNSIDAIIVGSDAVAQHHPPLSRVVFPSRKIITISDITSDRMCPNPFWGSFSSLLKKKVPMAMMSVSSQNSEYKLMLPFEKKRMCKYASNFAYISTRDVWTADMFRHISRFKINPKITPDPVFGFNYNVTNQPSKTEILKKFNLPENYYLLSFHDSKTVSEQWLDTFERESQKHGITPVALPFPNGIKFKNNFGFKIDLPLSPLDWYCLIKYSCGYIGHNMHPIIVCLHNAIPCFSFDNYGILKHNTYLEESSKIYHILKQFDLLDNRISIKSKLYNEPDCNYLIERLLKYDVNFIKKRSDEFTEKYISMMEVILRTIQ